MAKPQNGSEREVLGIHLNPVQKAMYEGKFKLPDWLLRWSRQPKEAHEMPKKHEARVVFGKDVTQVTVGDVEYVPKGEGAWPPVEPGRSEGYSASELRFALFTKKGINSHFAWVYDKEGNNIAPPYLRDSWQFLVDHIHTLAREHGWKEGVTEIEAALVGERDRALIRLRELEAEVKRGWNYEREKLIQGLEADKEIADATIVRLVGEKEQMEAEVERLKETLLVKDAYTKRLEKAQTLGATTKPTFWVRENPCGGFDWCYPSGRIVLDNRGEHMHTCNAPAAEKKLNEGGIHVNVKVWEENVVHGSERKVTMDDLFEKPLLSRGSSVADGRYCVGVDFASDRITTTTVEHSRDGYMRVLDTHQVKKPKQEPQDEWVYGVWDWNPLEDSRGDFHGTYMGYYALDCIGNTVEGVLGRFKERGFEPVSAATSTTADKFTIKAPTTTPIFGVRKLREGEYEKYSVKCDGKYEVYKNLYYAFYNDKLLPRTGWKEPEHVIEQILRHLKPAQPAVTLADLPTA